MNQAADRPDSPTIHYLDALKPEAAFDEAEPATGGDGSRLNALEARLDTLETAVVEHAATLRDRIGSRLDRLEDKLRYEASGLRRAMATEKGDHNEKIIRLTESLTAAVDRVELKQQAGSVKATMEDLIAALAATRSHLDTLAQAVSRTRADLSA